MTPKEYYYNQFNHDLQELITKSSSVHGSAEREIHIPIGEIAPDKITFESNEHRYYFFTALMFTFPWDSVRAAMLSDADVKEKIWGEIFVDMLQKST